MIKISQIFNPVILFENLQQAEKLYFRTGKIDSDGKEKILNVTHGDNYTKILSDFYIVIDEYLGYRDVSTQLREYYEWLKRYNNKFLPIQGLDGGTITPNTNAYDIMNCLESRDKIIQLLLKLPSIARRNFPYKQKVMDSKELKDLANQLQYFMGQYSLLENRSDEVKDKINKKIFRSGYSLDEWIEFIEEKENIFNEIKLDKDGLRTIINDGDSDLVYETDKVWVIEVYSPYTIQELGCNSYWCFTYGKTMMNNWDSHSYMDMVYLIVDWDEDPSSPEFMHVLIKPIDELIDRTISGDFDDEEDDYDYILYDMGNTNVYGPLNRLTYWICNGIDKTCYNKIKELFNFE